ncbi:MAG TPA: hypothetical protein PKH77_12540 [Anaerolineae bacterium]|nr:hypothetical protein [Anaerolineae bacterium]
MTTQNLHKPLAAPSWVIALVATLLSLPFLSFYWFASARIIPGALFVYRPGWLMPLSFAQYVPFAFFAMTLFGNLSTYILATLASVAVTGVGLVKGRPGKLLGAWLLLILVATLAFPLLCRYQPALWAAPGYQSEWVTNPGFWGGVIKAAQQVVEQRPCTYELLGWSADNHLYYHAACGVDTQVWQYAPSGRPVRVSDAPADLSVDTLSKHTAVGMMRTEIKPTVYEEQTRRMLLKSDGFISPDGQWTAVVTQHLYGPQDVVLFARTE